MKKDKPKKKKIIIEGMTEQGQKFRPSDWAERVSGNLSTFRNHRVSYSPLLQPTVKDGLSCVQLDPSLKQSNPELYQVIMDFAKTNQLRICNDEDADPENQEEE